MRWLRSKQYLFEIIQYKSTKYTFLKLIFQYLIFDILYMFRNRLFDRTHSATYKTAYADACKAHYSLRVYKTFFLKINTRAPNM